MRVLMVGNDPAVKGGITSVIGQLLEHDWEKYGIDMKFIPTYVNGNNIKKSFFFIGAYINILSEFKKNRPDVVHIHMSYRGSFSRKYMIHKLCKKYGIPDIIHLHGSEFEKWYCSVNSRKQAHIRTLLKECTTFIVLGDKWNQVIRGIEPKTNIMIVQNTVQVPKESVHLSDPCKVLFMGVLIQRKGVSDLLKAIGLLKENGNINRYRFIIAGTGEEENSLKQLCSSSGLDDYVEFVGWTSGEKKQKLFMESQMLVLPSYNEGLPIAILEAISYGMPIVSTNVGDISSAVIDGKNGFLIQPGDSENLAKAIVEVSDERNYKKFSEYSKQLAIEKFNEQKFFKQIIQLYKKSEKGKKIL